MNRAFVADSSVAIAWAVSSQSSRATDGLLDEVAAGASLVVPVLWSFELANALIMLKRRKKLTQEDCTSARRMLSGLAPIIDDEGCTLALTKTSELAERHSLSGYDATYLELALRKEIPLATRDAALSKAAKQAGVQTLL